MTASRHNRPIHLQGPSSLPIQLEVPTRIDSVHGGLRVTVSGAPDTPVTKVIVDQQGGQKGLFVNSTNLCAGKHRATAKLAAHNGRRATLKPAVRALGCGHRKAHRRHHRRGRGR
ncbi:MAG: hypothetical protein ACM3N0_02490 [Chloroflexota bacterium]